jgi:hypothetical protein
MTHISQTKQAKLWLCFGLLASGLALSGCNRDQVQVQDVPKESDPPAAPLADAAGAPSQPSDPHAGMDAAGSAAQPQIKWTLPGGWQDKPLTEFRIASFDAKGADGKVADVSVIPMPTTGREVDLVNMWRQQLQLPAVTDADADKQAQAVAIGSEQGKMFEFASDQPMAASTQKARMLVAMLVHNDTSFFFKITGEDSAVTGQKPAFLDFLKSVSFEAAPETAAANPHAFMPGEPAPAAPAQTAAVSTPGLPAGWKEIPNPQMLLAKYVIEGTDGAKAEVNVSALAGTGGGVLMNVNRWHGQLGLPSITQDDWSKQEQLVDVAGGKGSLVDITGTNSKTGQPARLIGIIAPQLDQTWFYKLMGDEKIVAQQKDTFLKFIQTAQFSNAP